MDSLEYKTPMLFVTEFMTTLLISLQVTHQNLIDRFKTSGMSSEMGLSALESFASGLAFAERANQGVLKAILRKC